MWNWPVRISQQGSPGLTQGLRQRCQQSLFLAPAVDWTFFERGMGAYIGHLGQPFPDQAIGGAAIDQQARRTDPAVQWVIEALAQVAVESLDLAFGTGPIRRQRRMRKPRSSAICNSPA